MMHAWLVVLFYKTQVICTLYCGNSIGHLLVHDDFYSLASINVNIAV